MGLSIFYNGCLKSPELIQPLAEEVADICEALNWKYHLTADGTLEGICLTPENCETLTLTFLHDGTLASRAFMLLDMPAGSRLFTKTQFAGMDTHMTIIHLLRYLREKYFGDFELTDEGMYWETGDVDVLRRQFSGYEVALDMVANALKGFEAKKDDTPAGLAARLEAYLLQRFGSGA